MKKIIICFTVMLSFFSLTQTSNAVPALDNKVTSIQEFFKPQKEVRENHRPYEEIIRQHAENNNIPIDLAHAVVKIESNYNKNARGSAGEIGLMQIKLATARGLGYRGTAQELYEPQNNIKYGMKYLGHAHELSGGNTCNTILKYNAGVGAKRMNPISARYCNKVKAYLASVN